MIKLKKWLIWVGGLVLILSLATNVYLYQQHMKTSRYVESAVRDATLSLKTAATMQIMPNVPNNSTQVQGTQVAQAASYLSSAAPFLNEMGIHHMQGIGTVLSLDTFPLMYPQMRNVNANQMLKLVQYAYSQLNACFPSGPTGKLDFGKLQTAINNIYQEMPPKVRQSNYNEVSS
ncbi:hypothetical protein [Alicyclobacillus mengziensis]|uniref:Uncharacterized protein n=1 Tax=Alicyclobacillus mengziensis TaxID=2931921 RepID=A0A9X7W1B9_9BACL|nr:hypothetical protein [Alicyclobacillus mengziensis]QSO48390.1 hypothetical protein JZ786_05225 [Alicyclobacillus mengziensis]